MSAEKRLQELGLKLPPAPKALGLYQPLMIVGDLAFSSGHVPLCDDGSMLLGRVGDQVDQQAGYVAARQTGLAILSTLQLKLGSLDRVKQVVKLMGLVNATADFHNHPAVINGCSELFAEVFGPDRGVGARSAFGAGSLPGNVTVEIEGVFEIEE